MQKNLHKMQSTQMPKIVCNRSLNAYHIKSHSLSNSSLTSGKKEPTVSNLTLGQPLDWLQMQITSLSPRVCLQLEQTQMTPSLT